MNTICAKFEVRPSVHGTKQPLQRFLLANGEYYTDYPGKKSKIFILRNA